MSTYWINDIEWKMMKYCLQKKGKWWANILFRNKEVNELYRELRIKKLDEVFKILENHINICQNQKK